MTLWLGWLVSHRNICDIEIDKKTLKMTRYSYLKQVYLHV